MVLVGETRPIHISLGLHYVPVCIWYVMHLEYLEQENKITYMQRDHNEIYEGMCDIETTINQYLIKPLNKH